jgi:hypothetical protein
VAARLRRDPIDDDRFADVFQPVLADRFVLSGDDAARLIENGG